MRALPFIVLAVCAAFLLVRQRTLRTLVEDNVTLKRRIAQAVDAEDAASGETSGSGAKSGERRGPLSGNGLENLRSVADINLEALAALIESAGHERMQNLSLQVRIRSLLMEATPEELEDLIQRAGELDIPVRIKARMIRDFLDVLAESSPGNALDLAVKSTALDHDKQPWMYSRIFGRWMKESPADALSWFDRQIAAGTLESKLLDPNSSVRLQFEAVVFSRSVDTDPAAMRARLLQLPEQMRERVFNQGHLLKIEPENDAAFATLLRETLPPGRQLATFNPIVYTFVRTGGYERVGEFLANIDATDAERGSIVENAAGHQLRQMGWRGKEPGEQEIAAVQKFAREQAPDAANLVTGRVLAMYAQAGRKGERAASIVRDLHAADPNDDLLIGFLEKGGGGASATEMAALIRDEERRAAILEKLNAKKR